MKAWCHFWKGYAYGRIGSIFYAGIINNDRYGGTNGNYVTKEAIIAESNAQYNLANADLGAATSSADYNAIIGKLIPSFCQEGRDCLLQLQCGSGILVHSKQEIF